MDFSFFPLAFYPSSSFLSRRSSSLDIIPESGSRSGVTSADKVTSSTPDAKTYSRSLNFCPSHQFHWLRIVRPDNFTAGAMRGSRHRQCSRRYSLPRLGFSLFFLLRRTAPSNLSAFSTTLERLEIREIERFFLRFISPAIRRYKWSSVRNVTFGSTASWLFACTDTRKSRIHCTIFIYTPSVSDESLPWNT